MKTTSGKALTCEEEHQGKVPTCNEDAKEGPYHQTTMKTTKSGSIQKDPFISKGN
jgi:hypothetical protein